MMKLIAFALATTIFAAMAARSVGAQTPAPTLMAPAGQSKSSRPTPPAKVAPAGRANPCSIYGEGFVNVPGSDTCVKVGGYVRTDAAVKLGH